MLVQVDRWNDVQLLNQDPHVVSVIISLQDISLHFLYTCFVFRYYQPFRHADFLCQIMGAQNHEKPEHHAVILHNPWPKDIRE